MNPNNFPAFAAKRALADDVSAAIKRAHNVLPMKDILVELRKLLEEIEAL